MLLDAGANPNIVYFRNGNTPLYQVAFMVGCVAHAHAHDLCRIS